MWKAIEAKIEKVGIGETKGKKGKRRNGEEMERAGKEEAEGEENGRDKKSSRGMGNLG